MNINYGFPPVINENSKIIILGSFPSVKSRQQGFYYGNPQNRFWKMLEVALNKPIPKDVDGRREFLLNNGIALWDVYEKCSIKGSADSDIVSGETAFAGDLYGVLKIPKSLNAIICNGKKSYDEFKIRVKDYDAIYMQSTSSANPRYREDAWVKTIRENLNK